MAPKKRPAKSGRTFGHVVPLGSTCLVARHLQNKGLRVCKFPFDWMYSTPYLVRHALTDNFKVFLDPKQYQMNPKSDAGHRNVGTIHKTYLRMQDTKVRKVVFPHHQLWSGSPQCKELRKSFLRAAQRCRQVLRAPKGAKGPKGARTLFVCALTIRSREALKAARDEDWSLTGRGKCPIPEEGGPELCSRAEILRLFKVLQEKSARPFHLEVVYLLTPSAEKKESRPCRKRVFQRESGRRSLRITELYCKGDNTGLVFPEDEDMLAFHNIITESGQRRFPLPAFDEDREATGKAVKAQRSQQPRNQDFKRKEWLKQRLRFVQKNPKVEGSSAHQRYERYKKAKTLQEFFNLGGCKGDFHNDQAHGFLSLR
ncbi:unnamed protein product [Durusdinium trenchii]|uniref:Uncharacterized protein n=2 Tax=Durusdinium trenchii TaxID=1381693 RepID=A0ABP0MTY7_9DINO